MLAKYVALYSAHLIKSNAPLSALKLFCTYGAPANPQNYNIYKALCQEVFNDTTDTYRTYANLRDMLLQVVSHIRSSATEYKREGGGRGRERGR